MSDQLGGPLEVEIQERGVLVVNGDIDVAGGPTLEAWVRQAERDDIAHDQPLVLDLSGVAFIDSSGLRTLLTASRRAAERGTTVQLRHAGPAVRRMLEITGTGGQFQIED